MLYIGRERAVSEVFNAHMPADPQEARTWMDTHEREARKNARLCDKIRLALPRELDEDQRGQLVQDYMADLTKGRVPWYAAIHQTEKDAHNPHAHIVVVDRDIDTGKRVLGLSDSTRDRAKKDMPGPSAVDWVRERWEHHANAALAKNGHEARIDRRTLEAQGIDRAPQIHVGPQGAQVDNFVQRPQSKAKADPSPRNPDRVIDYPMIDAGRTRQERNAEIIDLNLERAARSDHFETRVWAQFERDQRGQDRVIDKQIVAANRQRTMEQRQVKRGFADQAKDVRAARDVQQQLARAWIKQKHAPALSELKSRHASERDALKERQSGLLGRIWSVLDVSGRTRAHRTQERAQLVQDHAKERQQAAERIKREREEKLEAVRIHHAVKLEKIRHARAKAVAQLKLRQEFARQKEDIVLQNRAQQREAASRELQKQIKTWKSKRSNAPVPQIGQQLTLEKPLSHAGQDFARATDLTKRKQDALERFKAAQDRALAQEQEDKNYDQGYER